MASEPHPYGDRDGSRGRFAAVRALQVGYIDTANIQGGHNCHMAGCSVDLVSVRPLFVAVVPIQWGAACLPPKSEKCRLLPTIHTRCVLRVTHFPLLYLPRPGVRSLA